jgi:hypothetical protein
MIRRASDRVGSFVQCPEAGCAVRRAGELALTAHLIDHGLAPNAAAEAARAASAAAPTPAQRASGQRVAAIGRAAAAQARLQARGAPPMSPQRAREEAPMSKTAKDYTCHACGVKGHSARSPLCQKRKAKPAGAQKRAKKRLPSTPAATNGSALAERPSSGAAALLREHLEAERRDLAAQLAVVERLLVKAGA